MVGRRLVSLCAVGVVIASMALGDDGGAGQPPAFPASRPSPTRASTRPAAARPAVDPVVAARRREKLFDFLMGEYAGLLEKSKDRVGRSLVAVCVARIPRGDATDRLLEMAQGERDPLVRADRPAKEAWNLLLNKAAAQANAPRDAAALEALCEAVARWQSPDLMDVLLKKLASGTDAAREDAVREDALLRLAGSTAPGTALVVHQKWWLTQRKGWHERLDVPEGSWRALAPHFVPAPPAVESVDPDDQDWRRDLELRAPGLRNFDVGLCVDATGSMGRVLTWLKGDVGRLLQGIGAVAAEPRIGITFYRDHRDEFVAATKPLTHRVEELRTVLASMKAAGGGDRPEAVLEGLQDCYKSNKWSASKEARKIVILIGDAPPHPETQRQCEALVAEAAGRGFRLYAVPCAPDVPEFEALAAKGNGRAILVDMNELTGARRGPARAAVDPQAGKGATVAPAGRRLLSLILVDAINSQFKDRVEPMVDVLWEQLEEAGAGK